MMKVKLYLDLDGTLTVWKKCDSLEELYRKGYFSSLPAHTNVVEGVKILMREHPEITTYTLSATFADAKYAIPDKERWISQNLPEVPKERRLYTPCGAPKSPFVVPDYSGEEVRQVLLDDYTKNLVDWKASGYVGIKLINDINHTSGAWKGPFVDFSWSPEEIAQKIAEIALS